MPYVIGADEAGYGPNLGPLLIGATLWRVPEGMTAGDLWGALATVIVDAAADESDEDDDWRPALGDSKQLYQPSQGIGRLERGLLAVLPSLGDSPNLPICWRMLWEHVEPLPATGWRNCPCLHEHAATTPLANDLDDLVAVRRRVQDGLRKAGVRLEAVRCRSLFPEEFNRQCERLGNKAAVLSQNTLALVGELCSLAGGESVEVVCDKHGGRSRYGALVQHQFQDDLVEILEESQQASRYRFRSTKGRGSIVFLVGAERWMPAALASMAAKYLRELAMRAFNDFWQLRSPGLKPTAGYPGDAKRFWDDIAVVQKKLAIADNVLWRER